jgi:hypothetical protein
LQQPPFSEPAKFSKLPELDGKVESVELCRDKKEDKKEYEVLTVRVVFRVSIASKERALEVTPKKQKLSAQLPTKFARMSIS